MKSPSTLARQELRLAVINVYVAARKHWPVMRLRDRIGLMNHLFNIAKSIGLALNDPTLR